MSNDPLADFAVRMKRRSTHLRRSAERMVPAAFNAIADRVFLASPVWSGQSVVNWTASIGRSPKFRLVNVPKSGDPNEQGDINSVGGHIDKGIAQMARFEAAIAAKDVSSTYKKPKRTSKSSKSIWLTNVISYTPDLWTGAWPTNSVSLAATIDAGVRATKKFKVWKF
jgi:hypothetical protein